MCDSIENPRKLYVWDLEGNTVFTVGTFVEANWPSPETGRSGLQAHFTPDGKDSLSVQPHSIIYMSQGTKIPLLLSMQVAVRCMPGCNELDQQTQCVLTVTPEGAKMTCICICKILRGQR